MILLGLVFFFFCKFNSTGWVSFIWNLKSSKIWNFLEHWHYATNGKFQLAVERFPDVAQVPAYPDSCDMCQRVGLWRSVGAILLTVITTKPMCIVRYDYRVFCAHTLLCGANVLLKMSKRPANTLMGNKKSLLEKLDSSVSVKHFIGQPTKWWLSFLMVKWTQTMFCAQNY